MSTDDTESPAETAEARRRGLPFPVVGIGASAGGFEAVTALLRNLPADPGVALVVVIHLAADRPSSLAELLARTTQLPVQQAAEGMPVEKNQVYVIPPNAELSMVRGSLRLHPRRSGPRQFRPIDLLLESLAAEQGEQSVGVVLSGADADGADGLRAIKQAGGVTFAQDASARVPSMPESSISTGAVDFILPPEAMSTEIARLAGQRRGETRAQLAVSDSESWEARLGEEEFQEIVRLLREVTRVDFSQYKPNTLRRRILRRMGLHRIREVREFLELLRGNPAELKSLHDDILIHVTQFFRDPEAFRALEKRVIPHLIDRPGRTSRDPVRIWVPGCATGEEVYSTAICLLEALGDTPESVPVQIFGTDISEAAIERARAAVYAEDIAADVSPDRLRRFFTKSDSVFQVNKVLRDLCVFARHDLARDPPFSRLDLISCRNVLIYMSAPLQKRILPLLHYGLNDKGYLFLGTAESIGPSGSLFLPVEKHWNIHQRADGPARPSFPRPASVREPLPPESSLPMLAQLPAPPEVDLQREADRLLLHRYAPPGVVVNEQMEVLHFRGRTGPYLEPSPGKASHQLLSLAREGLRAGILEAVRGAVEGNAPGEARAHLEEEARDVRIVATPLGSDARSGQPCLLVIFEDAGPVPGDVAPAPPQRAPRAGSDGTAAVLARVRQENDALRLHLQAVIERYEAAHEELQSANEEILSSNEELQSTNEELGTSKEELQSSNEELSTVNDELQTRITELGRINDDLHNILASVQIPIVILTQDLRIRSFTPAAGALLNLIGTDVGRPLSHINIGVQVPDLGALLAGVLDSLAAHTSEVQDASGRWYTLRVRPYRTRENRIDGLILALLDIQELKRATREIAAARDYAEAIVTTVGLPLLVLDADLRVSSANAEFYRVFSESPEESVGRRIYELGNGQWDIPELRTMLEEVIPRHRYVDEFEVTHGFPQIGTRTMWINARRIESKAELPERILIAIDDVTERRRHEATLRERDRLMAADARKNEFLAILAHELRNPLAPIVHAAALLRGIQAQDPTLARATQIIVRQSAHMARLLEDLLDVSRITYGRVELRKRYMDLRTTLEGAVESVRPLLESRRHELRLSLPAEPIEVDGDAARLEQIFANLLGNAAKYTDPGGRIELVAQPQGGWIVVRVRDNGAGISAEMLPRVFDLFAQADKSLDRKLGGLGIGLTVVRRLVEMHGGGIAARSAGPGHGSEFVVRLPTVGAPGGSTEALSPGSERRSLPLSQQSRRVLVVDDNEDAAEVLRELLRTWGHEVRSAVDGPAALEAARLFLPELILLDIGLPGMSGHEVAGELRKRPGLERARIVAMTGYGQEEDRRRSREAGFDLHLVKPVTPDALQQLFAEVDSAEPDPSGR